MRANTLYSYKYSYVARMYIINVQNKGECTMNNIIRLSDYQYKNAYKAEIDIAHDCPIFDFMQWVEKYNLGHNLVKAVGPGGGNPCFEIFSMDKNALLAALSEHHQTHTGDEFLSEQIYK